MSVGKDTPDLHGSGARLPPRSDCPRESHLPGLLLVIAAAMATDAVQGAVASLQALVAKLKTSERFADQDAMVDLAEATALGLSHLRVGAGQVQVNVED